MKLEVGMFFRTKAGTINKIDSFTEDKSEFYFNTKSIFSDGECLGSKWGYTKDIIKASFNVIDLIEVGDYVNGQIVTQIIPNNRKKEPSTMIYTGINYFVGLYNEDIKSIVTHEQMEQISYKLGE